VIRLVVRTAIAFAGNAIGLIVAAALLDGVDINATSFLVAVVIFTVVFAIIQPFLAVQLRRAGSAALGGVALIATLVSLIVTDLVSNGFSISGIGNWIAATVIVWVVSLLAVFILPFLGLRKYLEERRA
jgi:putative membrane protein